MYMKNFFRLDNPVFQFLSTLADMVLVDVLCILFCLPVVTAGASIAATYKVVLDISRDSCGGIWNTFFRAFRENFKQATIVWLITLLIAASLICDFMLIRFFIQGPLYTVLFVIICILACTVAAVLLYLYPLMIRYQNTLREHLHNAMILPIYQFPRTLAMLFFHALPLLMALFLSSLFLYTLLFWLALGFSLVPMMDVYLLRPVFQKLDDMAHTTAC